MKYLYIAFMLSGATFCMDQELPESSSFIIDLSPRNTNPIMHEEITISPSLRMQIIKKIFLPASIIIIGIACGGVVIYFLVT